MKKTLVIILVLSFIFVGLGNSRLKAQYGFIGEGLPYGVSSLTSVLMLSDWQTDYLMPVDPNELKEGDYRLYGNAANINIANENNGYMLMANGNNEYNASVMNYFVGFDTAFRDNLYFHIKYDIVPWQSYESTSKDEINYKLLTTFIDYEFKEDKKIYFGYNHNNSGFKEYNEVAQEFYDTETYKNNIIYAGFEIKGSFSK